MAEQKLVVLHATDIHVGFDQIQQLKEWLKENNQRVDIILVSGDLANMSMDYNAPEAKVTEGHALLDQVVREFAAINSNVYYIPGNHDPISTFRPEHPPPAAPPCNVHMRKVCLAPKLHLIGLGGSIPGFQCGQHIWMGFPYRTDEALREDLSKLLDPIFLSGSNSLKPDDCVILMTHNGPRESCTTEARTDPLRPIISGSKALYEYLCKDELQKHVVFNIHGHTHAAAGQVKIGEITVINPGALLEGCFAIYTLESSKGTKPSRAWELTSVYVHKFPS